MCHGARTDLATAPLRCLSHHAGAVLVLVLVLVRRYVREWNTAARTSLIAQKVLQHVLLHVPADVLRKVPGIEEFVTHMAPYTERHFEVRPTQLLLPVLHHRSCCPHAGVNSLRSAWTACCSRRTCFSTRCRA